MTIQLLAKITPQEQQAAIDYAKNKPQSCDEMAEGEIAVYELSQTWHKSEEWVKRYLAATFLFIVSILGGFPLNNPDNHQEFERVQVRVTRTRREKEA